MGAEVLSKLEAAHVDHVTWLSSPSPSLGEVPRSHSTGCTCCAAAPGQEKAAVVRSPYAVVRNPYLTL